MKRPISFLIASALIGSLPCLGDPVVLPPDIEPPSSSSPNGSTPAPNPPEVANATILVAPFASAGNGDREWISKGIQQDLTADLIRSSRLHVVAPTDLPAVQDADAALKIGRDNHAAFVIFGHFQVVETNVRITGQVLETASGRSIGALKATGPTRDLFNMEDALSGQVISALPKQMLVETGNAAPMPYVYEPSSTPSQTAPAPTSDESGYYAPQTYVQAPSPYTSDYSYTPQASVPDYDNSNYGYGPYYPYYYNYWYPGFVVIGGHHHDHGHGGDGHNHGWVGNGRTVTSAPHVGASGGFITARAPSVSRGGGGFHASGGFSGGGTHGGGGGGHR